MTKKVPHVDLLTATGDAGTCFIFHRRRADLKTIWPGVDPPFDSRITYNKTMSLRIVYSQDFSIQPRYRKKTGITQDEHDRNVRRLKMFDRASVMSANEEAGAGGEQPNKKDNPPHNTQRANEDTGSHASAASSSADRLPSYSESSEPGSAPPAYSACPLSD